MNDPLLDFLVIMTVLSSLFLVAGTTGWIVSSACRKVSEELKRRNSDGEG